MLLWNEGRLFIYLCQNPKREFSKSQNRGKEMEANFVRGTQASQDYWTCPTCDGNKEDYTCDSE
jgi:hypothetical protein